MGILLQLCFCADMTCYTFYQITRVITTDVTERSGPVYADVGCTLGVTVNTVTVLSLNDDHIQYADIKHQARDVKQQCDSDSSVQLEPGT